MAKQQTEVRELDEGSYVMIEDVPCKITGYSTAKPGKHGSAKARIEATGVYDGQKRSLSQPVDAKIWVPIINRKQGQVLDVRDGEIQVMDLETYDNFVMRAEDTEDLAPDDEIEFLEHEDQRKIV
ncbi:translation initiation factor 5A precursor (eIF-5A) [Halovenus aranensis]|jgi:translation initiation factor 5A|uniref:Translation initiation factor 5A n=1 Tax=Halovenus aranensis TaxID=890420 RepID=A0A1G8YUT1_9EURY|nr:translation initiation factor IF-5A [Halovenus aranensis]SDK05750.1 translation initiation factor 5A precursor (eIF-5A) [Halovenus aranensis]